MASKAAGDRWTGHLTWRDLLFVHWPVGTSALRPHVPAQMEIDEFDGTAWIAVVPFAMTDMYVRGLPPLPGVSRTLELNVRTYVRVGGAAGVYFFSLDAASWLAVEGARAFYHLNYVHARMSLRREGERILYESRRTHRGAPPAEFRGSYWPCGEPSRPRPGSLEHWLTERYALFTVDGRGRLYRGDIHHEPWLLQPAEAEFERNLMMEQIGLAPPKEQPLLHFAKGLEVLVWWPERVRLR
jgi:hypothetical protein